MRRENSAWMDADENLGTCVWEQKKHGLVRIHGWTRIFLGGWGMKVMRLSRFFERFDSARDVIIRLKNNYYSTNISSGVDLAGARIYYDSFDLAYGKNTFDKRKGDVRVLCGGLCYVPSGLMDGIRFAERWGDEE